MTARENTDPLSPRAQADIAPPDSSWEVRLSPGKGRGVFARRAIRAGERIFAEEPLFAITPPEFHPGQGFRADEVAGVVNEAVTALSPARRAEFLACHEHREPHEEAERTQSPATYARKRGLYILRSNAYMLPDGRSAMFTRLARANHDCAPNAAHLWDPRVRGDAVALVATRDIARGEEVTVTYVDVLAGAAERRQRLAQYGFRCDCASCTAAGETDPRRQRMGTLFRTMGAYPAGGNDAIENARLLLWAEELVDMLEQDALLDYLPQAYGFAARLTSLMGDMKVALEWRRKEAEVLAQ